MSNGESLLQQPAETQTQLDQPLTAANSTSSLRENVETAMANYFKHLDGQPVSDVYQMVMSEIEAPLLEQVMKYVRNNQTKAAHLLGLNRGTLRKKLKQYGLL
ncbi:MAG: DNA-binding transcriptional regulator Fis [Cellvibrionales bacterium]|jgi:Fis family transcriptional regulator|nr:DNA-binding transcriptional regulator Fis [Cellvibrionales bacterium]MDG2472424.1 DNA-binding transcriptional regulator Fis [Pseudomonadales bacterium]|tara:strand:+ start:451 stop:759 length:309 start_codon:yes stop_codon:yes gene_type:complete